MAAPDDPRRLAEGVLAVRPADLGCGQNGGGPECRPDPTIESVLAAADRLAAGRPAVLADVGSATDARLAVDAGAAGIGLCRTEHLLGPDRVDLLWRVLTAVPGRTTAAADLAAFRSAQRQALGDIVAVDSDRPVTIRLLNASVDEVGLMGTPRGVRLMATRPDAYDAQIAALADVAARCGAAARLRILVPMVNDPSEVGSVVERVREHHSLSTTPVGAMIHTPSAALGVSAILDRADFVTCELDDLTRFALGLDHDQSLPTLLEPSVRHLVVGIASACEKAGLELAGSLAITPDGLDLAYELGAASVISPAPDVRRTRLVLGQRAARDVLGAC